MKKIEAVVLASKEKDIIDASHTGSLGHGKIFISTIDEIIDITTKQKGEKYI